MQLVLSALRQDGLIIDEHLELGMTDSDETITQLVAVLDTSELADAINRLERGFGLRVVKWTTSEGTSLVTVRL